MRLLILFLLSFPFFVYSQSKESTQQNTMAKPVGATNCCCNEALTSTCATVAEELPEIVVDFQARKITTPVKNQKFKRGAAIRIKVINYNPYLYKLNIDNRDSNIVARSDGNLLGWFLDPSNILSIVAGLSGLSTTPIGTVTSAANLSSGELEKYSMLQTELDRKNFLGDKVKENMKDKEALRIINEYRKKGGSQADSIVSLNNRIDEGIYEISKSLDFLNKLNVDCSHFTTLDATIKIIEEKYKNWRIEIQGKQISILLEKNAYLIEVSEFRDKIYKNWMLRVGDSLLVKLYSESVRTLEKMDSALSYIELKKVTSAISAVQMLRTCYTSLPLFFPSENKKFFVQFTPWADNTKLSSYNSSFEIPWQQNCIWGISVGVFISTLHNEGYSVSSTRRTSVTPPDTVYNFIPDNPGGGVEFGINALAYYAGRIKSSFFVGGSFGTGFSIESKPKPRIFLGPDLIFGEKNRLLISFGLAAGYVQRLSDAYVGKTNIPNLPTSYMKDYLKCGFYLSCHYSF